MTKLSEKEAISIAICKSQNIKNTVERLMSWDVNKTLKENSKLLNISTQYAHKFARQYGLNYRRTQLKTELMINNIKRYKEMGLTL